jgi:hypothetical protein
MYIDTYTLSYPLTETEIKTLNPNISFTKPFVAPAQYVVVKPTPQPSYDAETECIRESAPVMVDGEWYQVWEVASKYIEYTDRDGVLHTIEERVAKAQAQKEARQWETIRTQRNKLLLESDYTQVSDSPLPPEIKEVWRGYRQALRDITEQTDPFDITWPDVPDEDSIAVLNTNWKSFNFALFTDPDFVQCGISAQAVNPYLIPSIIERYGQITKLGLTESGFADYWNVFCASLSITVEHREQWAQLAEAHHLPAEFVAVIRG